MISKTYFFRAFFPIFLVSTFILSGCKKDKSISIEGELSLLCYNVAGLPEGLSSSSPELYTPFISPLLNEFNIVHVQEDFCYHDDLAAQNEHPHTSVPTPCVPFGDGLNTFSDFPIMNNFDRVAWSDCTGADCLTPKGFSFSQIEVEEGHVIDFYNIHCNAGGDDASIEARRGNLSQFINYMTDKSPENAIIIMGDFNCRYTREGDEIRRFLDLGFSDPWIDLIREGDIPELGSDRLGDCSPVNTGPNCEGVDKVFYRSNSNITLSATSYHYGDDDRYYYEGDLTRPLSDHSPIFTNIEYNIKE